MRRPCSHTCLSPKPNKKKKEMKHTEDTVSPVNTRGFRSAGIISSRFPFLFPFFSLFPPSPYLSPALPFSLSLSFHFSPSRLFLPFFPYLTHSRNTRETRKTRSPTRASHPVGTNKILLTVLYFVKVLANYASSCFIFRNKSVFSCVYVCLRARARACVCVCLYARTLRL